MAEDGAALALQPIEQDRKATSYVNKFERPSKRTQTIMDEGRYYVGIDAVHDDSNYDDVDALQSLPKVEAYDDVDALDKIDY